jgi:hypothetical protein
MIKMPMNTFEQWKQAFINVQHENGVFRFSTEGVANRDKRESL